MLFVLRSDLLEWLVEAGEGLVLFDFTLSAVNWVGTVQNELSYRARCDKHSNFARMKYIMSRLLSLGRIAGMLLAPSVSVLTEVGRKASDKGWHLKLCSRLSVSATISIFVEAPGSILIEDKLSFYWTSRTSQPSVTLLKSEVEAFIIVHKYCDLKGKLYDWDVAPFFSAIWSRDTILANIVIGSSVIRPSAVASSYFFH